jgi:hypothetical protein
MELHISLMQINGVTLMRYSSQQVKHSNITKLWMRSVFKFKQREGSICTNDLMFSFLILVKLQEFATFQGFRVMQLRTLFWDVELHTWVFVAQSFEKEVASSPLDHQPLTIRPKCRLKMLGNKHQ